MKVTGAPPSSISNQTVPDTGRSGTGAGDTRVVSLHSDAARHGVDETGLRAEMRSSPALADLREARRSGANELRNTMIRDFGADVVAPLFDDPPRPDRR
jgi:hypothetical protein